MSWREVSFTAPKQHVRPMGGLEAFVERVAHPSANEGREPWCIASVVSLRLLGSAKQCTLERIMEPAWKKLRFKHPNIAAELRDGSLRYEVPSSASVAQWANKTFFIAPMHVRAKTIMAEFTPASLMTLHYLPYFNELVIHSSQWRIDSVGFSMLWDSLFDAILDVICGNTEEPAWGLETQRLVPSFEAALGNSVHPTAQDRRVAQEYYDDISLLEGCVGIRHHMKGLGVQGVTRRLRVLYFTSITQAVLDACAELGLMLEAAVYASLASTIYDLAPLARRSEDFATKFFWDLRPHLPEPWDGPQSAVLNCRTWDVVRFPSSQTWLDRARAIHDIYQAGKDSQFVKAQCAFGPCLSTLWMPLTISEPGLNSVDFSYDCAFDRHVKPVYGHEACGLVISRFEAYSKILDARPHLYLNVVRGCINLLLVYNDGYYEREDVADVLQGTSAALLTNLGVHPRLS